MPGQDFLEYRIYRSDTGDPNTYTLIGTSQTADFVDSTVIPGNTYYYRVYEVSRYLSDRITFDYTQSVANSTFSLTVPSYIQATVMPAELASNDSLPSDIERRRGRWGKIYRETYFDKIKNAYYENELKT